MGTTTTADKLLAVADELICSADLQGYYTDVNPAFTRLLGWSEAELCNRPSIEFVHPDDREATMHAIKMLVAQGTLTDFRNRMVTKKGEIEWIDWKAYVHEQEIFAIGRKREGRRATDINLESVVTRVVRAEALEREQRTRQREEARAAEQHRSDSDLRQAEAEVKVAQGRASTFKTWVVAAGAIATTVGGFGSWAISRVEENALRNARVAQNAQAHKQVIDQKLEATSHRDDVQDQKLHRLGELTVETQVQVSDSTQYTASQLAAISSKAENVEEPESVRKAREKVEAIKKSRAVDDLFQLPDPSKASDPFAGLDVEKKE